jgi:hypothetical protein
VRGKSKRPAFICRVLPTNLPTRANTIRIAQTPWVFLHCSHFHRRSRCTRFTSCPSQLLRRDGAIDSGNSIRRLSQLGWPLQRLADIWATLVVSDEGSRCCACRRGKSPIRRQHGIRLSESIRSLTRFATGWSNFLASLRHLELQENMKKKSAVREGANRSNGE